MSARHTYWVHYSRDDNETWLAEVFTNPDTGQRVGVASYGRTLRSAKKNVGEALGLFLDIEPEQLTLLEQLPSGLAQTRAKVNKKREAAERADADASAAVAEAARKLVRDEGLSLRDVADILGYSHQRIQQLLLPGPGLDLLPDVREGTRAKRFDRRAAR